MKPERFDQKQRRLEAARDGMLLGHYEFTPHVPKTERPRVWWRIITLVQTIGEHRAVSVRELEEMMEGCERGTAAPDLRDELLRPEMGADATALLEACERALRLIEANRVGGGRWLTEEVRARLLARWPT